MSDEITSSKDLPYIVEYAKSKMSSCKKCKEKIDKGELRLGVMVQSPHFDGRIPLWHHFQCFFLRAKVKSTGDIEKFDTLRWEDQERIKKRMQGEGADEDKPKSGKAKKKSKVANGDLKDFSVEYAKSSRSSCKSCEEKIVKDSIRISKMDYNSASAMRYGPLPRWYHVKCFIEDREELEFFQCADSLPGFNSLTPDDRQQLKTQIKKMETSIKKKAEEAGSSGETSQPTKKQKLEETKEEKQLKKQNQLLFKYQDALRNIGLKRVQLQELLNYNNQEALRGEDAMLSALADCMVFGALKPCPDCKEGQLVYKANGYSCTGNITAWTKCFYTTKKPEKSPFKIPPEFAEEFPFLAKYKYEERERVFPSKVELPSAQQESNGKKGKPLAKLRIHILGPLSRSKEQAKADLESLGATVERSPGKFTALVISTQKEVEKEAKVRVMAKVEKYKIPVVEEAFLGEVQQGGVALLAVKHCLRDWGINIQEHLNTLLNASNSLKEEKAFTKDLPDKLRLMVKGGAAVDPDSGLESNAHVLSKGSDIYSAVLGMVDIVRGTNSFYKLQLLESDSMNRFWVFRAWGRVGTTIGGNKLEEHDSQIDAEMEFKRLYEEKTGNVWARRHKFVKHPGKFYPLDLDYGPQQPENHQVLKAGQASTLNLAVQQLICLIFDVDNMKKAMMEFEIDLKKMPLGKLSKKQIEAAYVVLSELQEMVKNEETSESRLVDAANRFYTLIPHDFGMRKPPLIRCTEVIKAKIDMLDSLLEIELAYTMLNQTSDGKLDPIDQHYLQLKADISPLPADSPEMDLIRQYVANTHAATHSSYSLQIEEVFKLARHTETKRFKPFLKLHNHKLLWHGSRITNFAGIISQGLRIAPPEAPASGYMFGKGVYFADMVSKSANYCCTSRLNPCGLLLLCRVALGTMYERRNADYIEKLPTGMHSTKGLGQTVPEPSMAVTLDSGVEVPLGKGISAGLGRSSLLYNEYIVYDTAQVKIEFLLKVKFNYHR